MADVAKPAVPVISADHVRFAEWEGKLSISFGTEDDEYPFSFQWRKAKKVLDAIEGVGCDAIVGMLRFLVDKK